MTRCPLGVSRIMMIDSSISRSRCDSEIRPRMSTPTGYDQPLPTKSFARPLPNGAVIQIRSVQVDHAALDVDHRTATVDLDSHARDLDASGRLELEVALRLDR